MLFVFSYLKLEFSVVVDLVTPAIIGGNNQCVLIVQALFEMTPTSTTNTWYTANPTPPTTIVVVLIILNRQPTMSSSHTEHTECHLLFTWNACMHQLFFSFLMSSMCMHCSDACHPLQSLVLMESTFFFFLPCVSVCSCNTLENTWLIIYLRGAIGTEGSCLHTSNIAV